jgi:hypothetical protein
MKNLWRLKLPFASCVTLCGIVLTCGIVFICFSCVSMVEKTGQALDGSAFAEKKIAVYRDGKKKNVTVEVVEVQNKDGQRSLVITLPEFPAMKLRASAPNAQGAFNLSSLDYLGGNTHGWNEYRLDIFGTGSFIQNDQTAVLSISRDIEAVQISAGRIHRYDTRITGEEALTGLRNRRERILSIVEWMNDRKGAPSGQNIDDFENYWKPLLFPEMVSKKHQPEGWQQKDDQWIRAESIRWNVSYTERTFPEFFREIRNSATLLRDWEEALAWIHLEYEWKRVIEKLSQEITLW